MVLEDNILVFITRGVHLYPFRTQKLSHVVPMVLPLEAVGESVDAKMLFLRIMNILERKQDTKQRNSNKMKHSRQPSIETLHIFISWVHENKRKIQHKFSQYNTPSYDILNTNE